MLGFFVLRPVAMPALCFSWVKLKLRLRVMRARSSPPPVHSVRSIAQLNAPACRNAWWLKRSSEDAARRTL
jgi:hypothetical protein